VPCKLSVVAFWYLEIKYSKEGYQVDYTQCTNFCLHLEIKFQIIL